MDATRVWPIDGAVRHYAWGSRTAIPELLAAPPDGEPQAQLWIGRLAGVTEPLREHPDRAGLSAFFARWMNLDPGERARIVASAVEVAARSGASDPAHAEVVRLARSHPGDPGVLAPLFLNLVELAPGEAIYLGAGELHSYLGGTGIELMANSD